MQSSYMARGASKRKSQRVLEESNDRDEEGDSLFSQYQYKAVGDPEKPVQFQCNLTEVYFELIGLSYGFHVRLEALQERPQAPAASKAVAQKAFQFSYDPIYKRFSRELRDAENKDVMLDKFFLELRRLKEQGKDGVVEDQSVLKYQTMSYVSFLSKRQKQLDRLNRGLSLNDEDEEEENPSEDDSNESRPQPKKAEQSSQSKSEKPPVFNPGTAATPGGPLPFASNNVDYNKMMVAGEGFGRDFLKGEIDRLIKILREKQAVGEGVHTFVRNEGPRKGWEEIT